MIDVIAHADWSAHAAGRQLAVAVRAADGRYTLHAPQPVGDPATLWQRLGPRALLGVDFPLGVPLAYAQRAGIDHFPTWLRQLGRGEWADFFRPATTPDEIALQRPFYPQHPGGSRRAHLIEQLGLAGPGDLLRLCDRPGPQRRAAAPLFWTLGAQQVGKAALHGWRTLAAPHLDDTRLWPFDGNWSAAAHGRVLAEVYPAETAQRLGLDLRGGKGDPATRRAAAPLLADEIAQLDAAPTAELRVQLTAGFPAGEHAFDALLGLLGMLAVTAGRYPALPPLPPAAEHAARRVEGWIWGRPAPPLTPV